MAIEWDDKQIRATLDSLERNVGRKFARQSLRAAAKIEQASERAGSPQRSGTMARGFKVRSGKKRQNVVSVNVVLPSSAIPGKTFYPAMQNYGWKSKGGKKHPGKRFANLSWIRGLAAARATVQRVLTQLVNKYRGEILQDDE